MTDLDAHHKRTIEWDKSIDYAEKGGFKTEMTVKELSQSNRSWILISSVSFDVYGKIKVKYHR